MWPHRNALHLQGPYFRMRSHAEVLGFRTWAREFGGDPHQPLTLAVWPYTSCIASRGLRKTHLEKGTEHREVLRPLLLGGSDTMY